MAADAQGTERRIALVIANAAYKIGRPLANPVNDAAVMTAVFKRLGFDPVVHHNNLGLIEMGRALADFAVRADEADMAVIYFAGHGMEVNGENYLLPIDADLEHVRRLPHEAKKLSEAVEAVDSVKQLGLIILDACRDNPYRGRMRGLENVRSLSGGLAAVELRGNTLVAYAAKHGTQAKDGPEGGNSPYAQALKDHFETPGLDVRLMFGRVRDEVLDLTRNAQEPHIYGALGGTEIYLKAPPQQPEPEQTSGGGGPFDPRQMEHAYWLKIQHSYDPCAFEGFLATFPHSDYAALARTSAEGAIKACREPETLERLLRDYPLSGRVALAQGRLDVLRRKVERGGVPVSWKMAAGAAALAVVFAGGGYALWPGKHDSTPAPGPVPVPPIVKQPTAEERAATEDDKAFAAAQDRETKAALDAYLKKYSRHADEAKALLSGLDAATYKAAETANTVQAFKDYRDDWPDGQYFARAGKRIAALEAAATAAAETLKVGESFRDCATNCPEMVVVPAGSFTMGSLEREKGHYDDEGPQHKVTIAKPFAVGRSHVTRGEFAAFVKATGHKTEGGCNAWTGSEWKLQADRSWRSPGFEQDDTHPVVCVNWDDAEAYAKWVSETTGKTYRLMTEAEAEYVARGTTEPDAKQPRYSFGNDEKDLCAYANGADQTSKAKFPGWTSAPCKDGYVFTAPVAHFKPNAFGLYDVHGNAWSWTGDCWNDSYKDAPTDGSANVTEDCSSRVLRGGSWRSVPQDLRSAIRLRNPSDIRDLYSGFRVSRTLNP